AFDETVRAQGDGFDNERVALPAASRVPGVGWIFQNFGAWLAPVDVHAPNRIIQLAKEGDPIFGMHNFHPVGHVHHGGHAGRKTLGRVVELVRTGYPGFAHHLPFRHVLRRQRRRVGGSTLRTIGERRGLRRAWWWASTLRTRRRGTCTLASAATALW